MKSNEYLDSFLKEAQSIPETIFDKPDYDTSIHEGLIGSSLKERLIQLSNLQSTIHKLAAQIETMYEEQISRVSEALENATTIVENDAVKSKAKAKYKQALVSKEQVLVGNDIAPTTYREESYRLAALTYLYRRAKLKVKELDNALDVGRSALSFDKIEAKNIGLLE